MNAHSVKLGKNNYQKTIELILILFYQMHDHKADKNAVFVNNNIIVLQLVNYNNLQNRFDWLNSISGINDDDKFCSCNDDDDDDDEFNRFPSTTQCSFKLPSQPSKLSSPTQLQSDKFYFITTVTEINSSSSSPSQRVINSPLSSSSSSSS